MFLGFLIRVSSGWKKLPLCSVKICACFIEPHRHLLDSTRQITKKKQYSKSIVYFLAVHPSHKSLLHCVILHVDCLPGSGTSASVRLFLCWVVQSIVAIDRSSQLHTISFLAWSLLRLITICYFLDLHLSTLTLDKCI